LLLQSKVQGRKLKGEGRRKEELKEGEEQRRREEKTNKSKGKGQRE